MAALALTCIPPVACGGQSGVNVRAFGDSITVGLSADPQSSESYVNQIADQKDWSISNQAVSGAIATHMAGSVYRSVVEKNDVALWLRGYNDMRTAGTDGIRQAHFADVVYALSVWLAVPDGGKISARSSAVTCTGSWSSAPYYGGGVGMMSSTAGDTATFVTRGNVVYIAITRSTAGSGGRFSVTVDGIDIGIWDCYGAPPSAKVGYAPCPIRVAGLSSGSHSAVLTVVSSEGNVYFDSDGGIPPAAPDSI